MTEAHACRLIGEAFLGIAVGLMWPFMMVYLAFGLWGEHTIAAALILSALVALVFVSPGSLAGKLRGGAVAAAVGLLLINDAVAMPGAVGVLAVGSCLAMGAVLLTTTPPTWDDVD